MMQEASKRRCNKIKLLSLSFVSKLISQKILIKQIITSQIYFGTPNTMLRIENNLDLILQRRYKFYNCVSLASKII